MSGNIRIESCTRTRTQGKTYIYYDARVVSCRQTRGKGSPRGRRGRLSYPRRPINGEIQCFFVDNARRVTRPRVSCFFFFFFPLPRPRSLTPTWLAIMAARVERDVARCGRPVPGGLGAPTNPPLVSLSRVGGRGAMPNTGIVSVYIIVLVLRCVIQQFRSSPLSRSYDNSRRKARHFFVSERSKMPGAA